MPDINKLCSYCHSDCDNGYCTIGNDASHCTACNNNTLNNSGKAYLNIISIIDNSGNCVTSS